MSPDQFSDALHALAARADDPEASPPTVAELARLIANALYIPRRSEPTSPPAPAADLPGDGLEFPPVDPSDIPPADGTDQLELELAVRESLGLSAEQWAALEDVERGQRIAQFRPAS